jgi:hypothetical protein
VSVLTRRRDHDRREECWLIYYGDVHVGAIAQSVGNPTARSHRLNSPSGEENPRRLLLQKKVAL